MRGIHEVAKSKQNRARTLFSQQADLNSLEIDNSSPVGDLSCSSAWIDAAIEVSQILRAAKIEAPLRPKVVATIVLALYQGPLSSVTEQALDSINSLVKKAIEQASGLSREVKEQLSAALYLSGADFSHVSSHLSRVIRLLEKLNLQSTIQTNTDVLGMFYEAFLRYGYDNNALGIVFTPRHIAEMCVHLTSIGTDDTVIDIACGTGGFLVAAFDAIVKQAPSGSPQERGNGTFYGFDTNPTVWALATLNMFLRDGGKSCIFNRDCFAEQAFQVVRGRCTRAYLNPPFSQQDEPESTFIDRAMEALKPGGLLATVVKASIFADDEHKPWRLRFLRHHSLRAVISLPEDIFYPTAVPTSLVIAQAHIPLSDQEEILLGRVWYDGYEKLKGRRVERGSNQIPEILEAYHDFQNKKKSKSPLVTIVKGKHVKNGREWSPQEWLAQPETITEKELADLRRATLRSILQAVGAIPELSSSVLSNFGEAWSSLPSLPLRQKNSLDHFFALFNGRSAGEKHYNVGEYPYISSGDGDNSIIRLVDADTPEIFASGGLTVTAFGLACIQPWAFVARGNGGSSVRVLIPKYRMSFREMLWFAAQINSQRWRFFYARMAIKGRLSRLNVWSPRSPLPDTGLKIAERVTLCQNMLDNLSQ